MAIYKKDQKAFDLLVNKISQSNGNISHFPPIAVSVLYKKRKLDTQKVLDYFLNQASNTWDDIKGLISNLLADSNQMNNVYILHNRCDDTNLLFDDFKVSKLENYLNYIRKSGSIISPHCSQRPCKKNFHLPEPASEGRVGQVVTSKTIVF